MSIQLDKQKGRSTVVSSVKTKSVESSGRSKAKLASHKKAFNLPEEIITASPRDGEESQQQSQEHCHGLTDQWLTSWP